MRGVISAVCVWVCCSLKFSSVRVLPVFHCVCVFSFLLFPPPLLLLFNNVDFFHKICLSIYRFEIIHECLVCVRVCVYDDGIRLHFSNKKTTKKTNCLYCQTKSAYFIRTHEEEEAKNDCIFFLSLQNRTLY